MVALREHATGFLAGVPYRWWFLLQDFFHLGGGLVLLTTAVGLLCVVTHKFEQIPARTVQLLLDCGCPPMAVNTAGGLMKAEPVGMHLLGKSFFIDIAKACAFAMVLLIVSLVCLFDILNGLDKPPADPFRAAPLAAAPLATAPLAGSGAVPSAAMLGGEPPAACDISEMSREERATLMTQLIQMVGR